MISDDVRMPSRWRFETTGAFALPVSDVATLADGLLACLDAPLLTIALAGTRLLPVLAWDDRLAPCRRRTATLYTDPVLASPLDALHAAVAVLAGRLDALHPADAPRSLVTDGIGLALVETPPGTDTGWLLSAATPGNACLLKPFAAGSLWALLRSEADARRTGRD